MDKVKFPDNYKYPDDYKWTWKDNLKITLTIVSLVSVIFYAGYTFGYSNGYSKSPGYDIGYNAGSKLIYDLSISRIRSLEKEIEELKKKPR